MMELWEDYAVNLKDKYKAVYSDLLIKNLFLTLKKRASTVQIRQDYVKCFIVPRAL